MKKNTFLLILFGLIGTKFFIISICNFPNFLDNSIFLIKGRIR